MVDWFINNLVCLLHSVFFYLSSPLFSFRFKKVSKTEICKYYVLYIIYYVLYMSVRVYLYLLRTMSLIITCYTL